MLLLNETSGHPRNTKCLKSDLSPHRSAAHHVKSIEHPFCCSDWKLEEISHSSYLDPIPSPRNSEWHTQMGSFCFLSQQPGKVRQIDRQWQAWDYSVSFMSWRGLEPGTPAVPFCLILTAMQDYLKLGVSVAQWQHAKSSVWLHLTCNTSFSLECKIIHRLKSGNCSRKPKVHSPRLHRMSHIRTILIWLMLTGNTCLADTGLSTLPNEIHSSDLRTA